MSNNKLTQEQKAKIAHNEYNRKWRKEHKDKMREYELKHWAKLYDKTHDEAGDSSDR